MYTKRNEGKNQSFKGAAEMIEGIESKKVQRSWKLLDYIMWYLITCGIGANIGAFILFTL